MKKVISLGVALVMLAVVVVPALAAPPEPVSYQGYDGPYLIADCGDFTVLASGWTNMFGKVYFDNDGNLTRIQTHWEWESTYFSPETGVSVDSHERMNWVEDFVDGQYQIKQTGIAFKLNVPGYGPMVIDVGLIVFDENFHVIRSAGQHPVNLGPGDSTKLCEYFSG